MTQHHNRTGSIWVGIDERVLDQVSEYVLGLIAVPGIGVTRADPGVEAALTRAEDDIHEARLDRALISELPTVAAWREAYRTVGVNPNRFPCAVESLMRRAIKGGRLPRINSAVDLCNSVSISAGLPVAACNVGGIEGRLIVRPADGGEKYLPLGSPEEVEHPDPGEIIYADEQGRAHSRRWNWRQSDVIKTDLGHRRLLITVESAHPGGREQVTAAMDRIVELLEPLGVDRPQRTVLDRNSTGAELLDPEAAL